MINLLSTVAFLAVIGVFAWVGWGLEPHWSSRDGSKFMCRMYEHPYDVSDRPRWRDVKVSVTESELLIFARSRKSKDLRGVWKITGAMSDDSKKKRLYELRSSGAVTATLRVPQNSRCVPILDALVP